MKLFLLIFAVASALLAKETQRDWKTAKVLDEALYRASSVTGANTNTTATVTGTEVHATSETSIEREAVKSNQLVLVTDDYVYIVEDTSYRGAGSTGFKAIGQAVGQAVRNRKHGCRFVIGEDIRYAQDKGTLYVIDADGKECHTAILRQERRGTPNVPSPVPKP